MALNRKFLKALGIEDDKADQIIDEHTATVDRLTEENKTLKADADKYAKVQKELDDLKANTKSSAEYDKLKKEFDDYKADTEAKETKANKTAAYRALLKEIGVSDKRIDTVIRASAAEIDALKLDKDGNIDGKADLSKSLKTDWADFIGKEDKKGADIETPPGGGSGVKMSREEIYKKDDKGRYIHDSVERQKALAELMSAEE